MRHKGVAKTISTAGEKYLREKLKEILFGYTRFQFVTWKHELILKYRKGELELYIPAEYTKSGEIEVIPFSEEHLRPLYDQWGFAI